MHVDDTSWKHDYVVQKNGFNICENYEILTKFSTNVFYWNSVLVQLQ